MKKTVLALLVLASALSHAQTITLNPLLIGTSATPPAGSTKGLQISEEAGTGYINVGVNTFPATFGCALGVGNVTYEGSLPPDILLGVYNQVNSPLPSSGSSSNSFVIARSNPAYTSADPALDMIVDGDGNVGFGTIADQFYPAGTHFGIVQADNTSTLPLFTTYTNTNN